MKQRSNNLGAFVELGYRWSVRAPGLKLPRGRFNQARHHDASSNLHSQARL
jgi:hypothetical protein